MCSSVSVQQQPISSNFGEMQEDSIEDQLHSASNLLPSVLSPSPSQIPDGNKMRHLQKLSQPMRLEDHHT